MRTKRRLLIFTRYPEAGKTKTRLIPELGEGGAALLQKKLTERVACQANLLTKRSGIEAAVHYCGGSREQMTSWLGSMKYVEQANGDLGQRMHSAFEQTFANGVEAAVLIGTDIPDITADLLQRAFTSLLTREVVIGPSQDGGYYLIGLIANQASRLLPLFFEKIPWSTGELFNTTRHRLEKAGYDIAILPVLRDIDLPADLQFAGERDLVPPGGG